MLFIVYSNFGPKAPSPGEFLTARCFKLHQAFQLWSLNFIRPISFSEELSYTNFSKILLTFCRSVNQHRLEWSSRRYMTISWVTREHVETVHGQRSFLYTDQIPTYRKLSYKSGLWIIDVNHELALHALDWLRFRIVVDTYFLCSFRDAFLPCSQDLWCLLILITFSTYTDNSQLLPMVAPLVPVSTEGFHEMN